MKNNYQKEVVAKWGDTEEYLEHTEKNHTEEKLNESELTFREILNEFALCKKEGIKVVSPRVQQLVQRLHKHINDNHFTCSKKVFLAIADMYTSDERFQEFIDQSGDQTAIYIQLAVIVYCKE